MTAVMGHPMGWTGTPENTRVKALSLWQPWASLVALGVKQIETRSWKTDYRGPLLIHAAKTFRGFLDLPGDCEGKEEAGWRYGYIGDFQAGYCYRTSDEGRRGDTFLVRIEGDGQDEVDPLPDPPMGAIVARATLVDCVPMGLCNTPYAPEVPDSALAIAYGGEQAWHVVRDTAADVTDQLPYGDFRPGRWAWMLQDIKPVDPPIPARGGQQLWTWTPNAAPQSPHGMGRADG